MSAALCSFANYAAAEGATATSPPREQLGSQRQLVLSVEGLLSIRARIPETLSYSLDDGAHHEVEGSSSNISVLTPMAVAADGFVFPHLSMGLSASVGASSDHSEATITSPEGTTTTQWNHGSGVHARLSPRIGTAWTADSGFGVWARAQLDMYLSSQTWSGTNAQRQTTSDVGWGVTGDALITYSPLPRLAVMCGPRLNVIFSDWGPSQKNAGFNVNVGMFF